MPKSSKLHQRPTVRVELPSGRTVNGYVLAKGWDGMVTVITVAGGRYTLPSNRVSD